MKIYNIKPLTLQRIYNEMHENGKSSCVIYNLNKLLKTFFNYAIKEGYILSNPCFKAVIPEDITDIDDDNLDVDSFTDEEIEKIKTAIKPDMLMLFLLDLGTGLRKGELLGLTLKDIDVDNKELKVTKALKRAKIIKKDESVEYKVLLETPKTKNSIRTIPIPSTLIIPLKEYIATQNEKFLSNDLTFDENSFIFSTSSCLSLDGKNVLRAWERCLKRAKVRYRKFHNIRHTYATKLFEAGVNLKTVQMLLGHANINITADTYTHVMPKEKINAVDKINHLFIN